MVLVNIMKKVYQDKVVGRSRAQRFFNTFSRSNFGMRYKTFSVNEGTHAVQMAGHTTPSFPLQPLVTNEAANTINLFNIATIS